MKAKSGNKAQKPTMITTAEKWGFLTFSAASNIVFNFKSIYYLIFLTNVLKIPVLTAGTILTLGTIWDALNDPLIGLWAANHKFKNGERIRPLALWFSLPFGITTVLMFTNFHTKGWVTVALCIAIYFVFEAFNTYTAIPYNAMGSLASNLDSDRQSINAFRSLGACVGSGIGAVAVTPLVKLFGGLKGEGAIIGEGDGKALFLTALFMGVLCVIGCLAHYFTTRERVQPEDSEDEIHMSMFEAYKILFKCKSWIWNMCYIIGYGIVTALIMDAINYYAAYVIGDSAASTPILAVYLVMAVLFSIITPAIDLKFGRKATAIFGVLIQVVGKIPFMLAPYSMAGIYINALTTGIGSTITFILFNTNRNNIADILEFQSGKRIDAMVAAGDNLISKLAEAGAVQLMAVALSVAGFNEALKINQTPETIKTIIALLGWVPALVAVLMFLVLLKLDTKKEYDEEKAKAEAKNAA